jgi:sugar phosphate isomerase/epimerase
MVEVQAKLERGGHQVETITHVFGNKTLGKDAAAMALEAAGLSRTIEMAKTLGARSIYMLTGGRGAMQWEQAAEVFAATIQPCLAPAQDAGIKLAIENTTPFFAHGHIGNNLRDTITLAEIAGIGVCIDYYACWTEAGMREQFRRAMPRLVLVQVSDYVPGDKLASRAVPGDGAIPWPTILEWLQAEGYRGRYDFELFGPRIEAEGQRAAVKRAADTIGTMLNALEC